MISIEATTADDAWRRAARLLQVNGQIQQGRDQPTRELLHVAFSLADPRQRLVFAWPLNPALAVAEVIWILSGGNASKFLTFWNPRMKRYVDDDTGALHGAYGHRLGSRPRLPDEAKRVLLGPSREGPPPLDQLWLAYEALLQSPDSRQVVLQIWDSVRDLPDPKPRSADVPCNLMSHLMIRDGRLEWLQIMRSNDLIWGTPLNFVQFTCLQEIVAGWLGVEVGSYTHVSDSLHVYQRHWAELDALVLECDSRVPSNLADLRIKGYHEWEQVWGRVAGAAVQLGRRVDPDQAVAILDGVSDLPTGYVQWIALLAAESLRRHGHYDLAAALIDRAGGYWATSWRRWYARKHRENEPSVH
jgi:thymidylate synthase